MKVLLFQQLLWQKSGATGAHRHGSGAQTSRGQKNGFSVIEVILAAALFLVFATAMTTTVIQGFRGNRLGGEQTIATQFAAEGIEAARSLKNQAFANLNSTLCSPGAGLQQSGGVWAFKASGTSDVLQKFTRIVTVCNVQRDGSGNIVNSGGSNDPLTKKVTSTVTWNVGPGRSNSVVLNEYFTNWKLPFTKGGMIVYGNGGTTSDAIQYRVLDSAGNWSAAASAADVDTLTTTNALRAARVYASATRNEKVLVSRHFNGVTQTIYAQVYNGTTWGNVVQLASFVSVSFLDVQNFDGTYLANGDFMVAYSDNTNTPKFRTWNGTSWSAQVSARGVGGIPNVVVLKNRPSTNEVMLSTFTQNLRTVSEYFNGGAYLTANWGTLTVHATNSVGNTFRLLDFEWDPATPTKGAIVYSDKANDKAVGIKIWTANGSGSGSWSGQVKSSNQGNNMGAMAIAARPLNDEYITCDKDSSGTQGITCYQVNNTPAFTNPVNQTIATFTDSGLQRSFHIGFEQTSGAIALAFYSDNTNVPKFKKYTVSSNTWDAAATSVSTGALTPGVFKSVRLIPRENDDIMVIMSDANQDLYSVLWDGTTDAISNTAGFVFTQHGTNGSAGTDLWYDFTWDKF
jgi:Tfp pilus assembly protein PilV